MSSPWTGGEEPHSVSSIGSHRYGVGRGWDSNQVVHNPVEHVRLASLAQEYAHSSFSSLVQSLLPRDTL